MTETSVRRKRLAEREDDEGDERQSPRKRTRAASSAFKWLWSPSPPSPPSATAPSSQGLWATSDSDRLFRTPNDRDTPRSFSLPPENRYRRPRRRGAISVTSPAPSELDRHLAVQLQQQIAIIRLKSATRDLQDAEGDDDVERMRRELEDVQIDATLPSILGISLDFDRKLDLGSASSRPPEGPGSGELGSPAQADATAANATCRGCLWESGKAKLGENASLRLRLRQPAGGCGVGDVVHVSGRGGGVGRGRGRGSEGPCLWRRPRP